ncbi:hypothetical protein Patl1_14449 [Pistacia atlantica]|uniref:Uncharacterized protein n=1 Tax=Pistacia atlantica TaxID=434234 RepID=A0ACC1ARX7_9ROSI|nr:hypothetical protein Patl1_14449 [Pistacia atlantica]
MATVIARPSSIMVLSRQKSGSRATGSRAIWPFHHHQLLQQESWCSTQNSDAVRDRTTNPEWEKAYQYQIPVLAKVLSDGTEQPLFQFLFYTSSVGEIEEETKEYGVLLENKMMREKE